jgi:hypothetical protein
MPRALGVSDYSDAAPLEAIRGLMSETNSLLCIAFRRTHITRGSQTVRVGRNYESRPMNDQGLLRHGHILNLQWHTRSSSSFNSAAVWRT